MWISAAEVKFGVRSPPSVSVAASAALPPKGAGKERVKGTLPFVLREPDPDPDPDWFECKVLTVEHNL